MIRRIILETHAKFDLNSIILCNERYERYEYGTLVVIDEQDIVE